MLLAVIIATKNRPQALERYALPSLERSALRDFICAVWDASDDDATEKIARNGAWTFSLEYRRAPRPGLASQRNDAAGDLLARFPTVRYVLFIDDDTELSRDALDGVVESFRRDPQVWGVNLPGAPLDEDGVPTVPQRAVGARKVTPSLHNWASPHEPHGIEVDWLSGCGMAFRREALEALCFPEDFQCFGGYALGEDVAFSFYLKKKMGGKLVNARRGTLCHHAVRGGRPDVAGMAASKWYNFHLLFESVYHDVRGPRLLWLRAKFKLFMAAASLQCLVRARSFDLASVLRGVSEAREALRDFHRTGSIERLMCREQPPA